MSDLDQNAVALAERMTQFGVDAVDLDMLKRGDMLGSLGSKIFHALEIALSPVVAAPVGAWLSAKGVELLSLGGTTRAIVQASSDAEYDIPLYSADRIDTLTAERDAAVTAAILAKPLYSRRQMEARIAELDAALRDARMQALASDGQAQEAQKHVLELVVELVKHAVRPEYDYPADVPEYCGEWCEICKGHVDEKDKSKGHAPKCIIARALSKSEPVKG